MYLEYEDTASLFGGCSYHRMALRLSCARQEPAPIPELVRVPVDDEGREILAG